MQDYFKDFLINKGQQFGQLLSDDPNATPATIASSFSAMKCHIVWALIATALTFVSWKAGKWYASYELLKQQKQPVS